MGSLFSLGNLLTLGIVAVALVLFKLYGNNSNYLRLAKLQGEKLKDELKDELNNFISEKTKYVNDTAMLVDTNEHKSKILLEKLQEKLNSLEEKSDLLNKMERRLSDYSTSISELNTITERVEINLARIGEESVYVENVGKNLGGIKAKMEDINRTVDTLEKRIEKETESKVKESADAILSTVRENINSLAKTSELIEEKVAACREAVETEERERRQKIEHDMDSIKGMLKTAAENAESQAESFETSLLETLREDAAQRAAKAENEIADKINSLQKTTEQRITNIDQFVEKESKKWQEKSAQINNQQEEEKIKWDKDCKNINIILETIKEKSGILKDNIDSQIEAIEIKIDEYKAKQEKTVNDLVAQLSNVAEETCKKSIQEADTRLEEYREAQSKQFESLEKLSSDAIALDNELRTHLKNITEKSAAEFNESVSNIKAEIDVLNTNISELKSQAFGKISEKLIMFESDFNADLVKRSENIDSQLLEWKKDINKRMVSIEDNLSGDSKKLEKIITDSMQQKRNELDQQLETEIEKIKASAVNVEKKSQQQIERADNSIQTLQEQLHAGMEEMRENAANTFKEESARLTLQYVDKVKEYVQKMEDFQTQAEIEMKAKYENINAVMDKSREDITEFKRAMQGNEQQLSLVRGKIEEINEQINSYMEKTKLIDKAEDLKNNLLRSVDELNTEMEKLDLRRTELSGIETQINKIKRTEDEMNGKMSQFLQEQSRIERMEDDFKRLLLTSQSVEEKLAHVTSSDDQLQEMQVNLRKLNAAIAEAEEKFHRIEKKNQTLEVTNDGIDRNFKLLQDSEKMAEKLKGDLLRITVGFDDVRNNIERLAAENEKANNAAEKITAMEKALSEIENQINKIDTQRAWLANLETRLDEKNKEARDHVKLVDTMLKKEGEKIQLDEHAHIARADHDRVVSLSNSGWTEKEISKTMKISLGAVQLILENAKRE
ncbi:MAG: hypothetical protein LBV52_01015 [Spirochaetaceae bacterium]|jgi:chromosome segregation ATPase|nr:hypothetical protein [Spirochaetaceae bacterium]